MRGTTSWARAVLLAAAAGLCFPAAAEITSAIVAGSDAAYLVEEGPSRTVAYSDRVGLRNLRLFGRSLAPTHLPRANLCENRRREGSPAPSASSCEASYGDCLWAGIDGVPWAGEYEWCNDHREEGMPWYRVEFAEPALVGEVRLFTRDTYPLSDFTVVLETPDAAVAVAEVRGNTDGEWSAAFEPIEAVAIRVDCLRGPDHQPSIRRIQELQAFAPRPEPPEPPRSFAYRVDVPAEAPIYVEVREVYTHASTLADIEYEVRIDGRAVHTRRHRCDGPGPISYSFELTDTEPGAHVLTFVDTSGAGLAINRVRVISDPVNTARRRGLLRPFIIAPRIALPHPFDSREVDRGLEAWVRAVSRGAPHVQPGLLAIVGYAAPDVDTLEAHIRAYADLAARHGIPWVLQLSSWWADTPLHVPDGEGGRFGDVRYQQIGWSEHDAYDDPGLAEYLESRAPGSYDRRYGLTVPNIWSSTPWLTMNDDRLNAYKVDRLRTAAAVVNQVQAGPTGHLLRAVVTDDEPMYWPRITDWMAGGFAAANDGVLRPDLILDVNPCVVEDAATDGVILDPRDGLSPVERQWLHENNARYAEMVCRTLRDALEPRPKGSREADLRDRIFNYILAQPCYPLDDYGRPGWHLGIVDGAAIGLEAFDERYFARARDLGPLANSDLECANPSAETTLAWEGHFRAWHDVGCQFIQLCNAGPAENWTGLFEAMGQWDSAERMTQRALSALIQEAATEEWRAAEYRAGFEPW